MSSDPLISDLGVARTETGEVLEVERLGWGVIELTVRLPHLAGCALPGQFAQLRCGSGGSPLLRRPFSVAWTAGSACAFVFAPVGEGTRWLAELVPGDRLDSLGPLGRGFTTGGVTGRVVCVAGGLGCAPFPLLIRALRGAGVDEVVVLNGASTATRLYPAERFQRGDATVRVIETTDDGSRGGSGRVTAGLAEALRPPTAALYGCGPNPMLSALASAVATRSPVPAVAEVSVEAPMGCGFGTCLGCALPVLGTDGEGAWALCCREGPVMPMDRVDWPAMGMLPPPHVA